MVKAITSNSEKEIKSVLRTLVNTHDGTFFMHESFNKNNASDYTRPWFAWANSLFGELVLKLNATRQHLLTEELYYDAAYFARCNPTAVASSKNVTVGQLDAEVVIA